MAASCWRGSTASAHGRSRRGWPNSLEAPFPAETEVTLYQLEAPPKPAGEQSTGELLAEMGMWNFGLPFADVLPDGDVLVTYYAGTKEAMSSHWARTVGRLIRPAQRIRVRDGAILVAPRWQRGSLTQFRSTGWQPVPTAGWHDLRVAMVVANVESNRMNSVEDR